jgi:hypothetical protein
MLAAMGCVLKPRSGVYVSTPITTGPRFVQWRRGPGAHLQPDSAEYEQRRHEAVIVPNREAVAPLVESLHSQLQDPVIDPTALEDVPGWEQFEYHRFWAEVVDRYVHTAVFADGWEYSSGCVLELAAALSADVATQFGDLTVLSVDEASARVQRAIADVAQDDVLPQEPLHDTLAALREQAADPVTSRAVSS